MLLDKFSGVDREFDKRRKENRLIAKKNDLRWEAASAVHPTQQEGHRLARIISPELGFNIHTFRVFRRQIGGGGVEGAFHTHGDAVKYYLKGEGKEIIDQDEYVVKAGDLAYIPANIWHGTENTGHEPMEFIAFHQIPGTHLPVPASWQYEVSDMEGSQGLREFVASVQKDDPASMDSATLYSKRQHFLHELGVLDDEYNRRRQQKRYVVRQSEIPWDVLGNDQSTLLIGPELGFNIHTIQVSIRIIPAQHSISAAHSHGEAVHYFLTGRGSQVIEKETLDVETGDLVFVPAGVQHKIINPYNEPLRFLVAEQLPGTYLQIPTFWNGAI